MRKTISWLYLGWRNSITCLIKLRDPLDLLVWSLSQLDLRFTTLASIWICGRLIRFSNMKALLNLGNYALDLWLFQFRLWQWWVVILLQVGCYSHWLMTLDLWELITDSYALVKSILISLFLNNMVICWEQPCHQILSEK